MAKRAGGCAVFVFSLALGCSAPGAPTPPGSGATNGSTIRIAGYVMDVAMRPIGGASVDVVSQSQLVTTVQTTNQGTFEFSGVFTGPLTLRASKDGFREGSRTVEPRPMNGVTFYLESTSPSATIELGTYSATYAMTTCTNLPAEVRARTYSASITATGPSQYLVTVDGTHHWLGGPGAFGIGIVGDFVAITEDTAGTVIEQVPPNRTLEYGIGGSFTASAPVISAFSIPASVAYCESASLCLPSSPAVQYCSGTLSVTRR